MLRIRGGTLAGMAAAARLARLGHRVRLGLAGRPLGAPWAAVEGPEGLPVDVMPQVFRLPALWRDLFTKTGRPLAGSTGAVGLQLVTTAGAEHRFSDGSSLRLPSDRGQQFHAIRERYGTQTAEQWRDLLDELDQVWLAWRRHGVESVRQPTAKHQHASLWLDRTLGRVAGRLNNPHLAAIVTSCGHRNGTDSPAAPALLAVDLVLERTFDRWQLVDRDGNPAPASAMIGLLSDRLRERGVDVVDDVDAPDLDCLPELPAGKLLQRPVRAALAPRVRHELIDAEPPRGVEEFVDHSGPAPVITWRRGTPVGTLASTHDYRHAKPDVSFGIAPDDRRAWLRRVPVDGETIRASVCSPAGNAPWAELASAALATYALHQRITGVDPSPNNKTFTPPPLRDLHP